MLNQNQKSLSVGSNPLRLSTIDDAYTQPIDTNGQGGLLEKNDPRWLYAVRVQMSLGKHCCIQSIHQYEKLVDTASFYHLTSFQARQIIGIVETSMSRGGMDRIANEELIRIDRPSDDTRPTTKLRWMTFGVLFGWSLLIAGMMQFV